MLERCLPRWIAWTIDPEQARRASFLAHSPLFAGLPHRLLGRLGTRFLEKAYSSGDVVFHEGDPGRALFVVVEGTVEITQATPRGEHVLRTLGAGDVVVINRGVEHELHSEGGMTFVEALSPVLRDHVPDLERDLVLCSQGDSLHADR